jgi:SM-20-related protein
MTTTDAEQDLLARVTRRVAIDGKPLVVLDGVFREEDITSLFSLLERSPYRLDDRDTDETAHVRHWKAELPIPMAQATPILRDCIRITELVARPDRLSLHRVYANLEMSGDIQFPHIDRTDGITCLYYANAVWEGQWQGETVFYDDRGEACHVVAPRPGRVALLVGGKTPRGGVPSRECYVPRITVAFKFSRGGAV